MDWLTIWGYGAEIRAAGDTLFVRKKGQRVPDTYQLADISHILIAGDTVLHTSVVAKCSARNIPISFFDIRGNPAGCTLAKVPRLSAAQDAVSAHAYAKAVIESSIEARMRILHELAETHENFYCKGEFEILAQIRGELEYLITLPELSRAFTLTRDMYYEIISRAVPKDLGYKRRCESDAADPVNVLFSKGYAALYATVQTACIGAGLDLTKSSLFGREVPCSGYPCVREIMEPALVPMVDRAVIKTAAEGLLSGAQKSGSRWILPEKAEEVFSKRLRESIDVFCIEANVKEYRDAVLAGKMPEFHYPA